ncbi:MAG: hypothetical protein AAGF49_15625 [Pseudomonadota bacterium]
MANNYMDAKLSKISDIEKSNPTVAGHRMEMTRWSLRPLTEATGIGAPHIANRMADYGIDPWWMSHEPWIVPEPFTPEAGELWSKDDIDYWIAALEAIIAEAHADPELVKSAPHRQPIAQVQGDVFEDPERWAMTWRAYLRKRAAAAGGASAAPQSAVATPEDRG